MDEDDTMDADYITDPSNPFRKQGETQDRSGKRKVVSFIASIWMKDLGPAIIWLPIITSIDFQFLGFCNNYLAKF